jgi:hypothetical protein
MRVHGAAMRCDARNVAMTMQDLVWKLKKEKKDEVWTGEGQSRDHISNQKVKSK